MKTLVKTVPLQIAAISLLWLLAINAGDMGTLDTDLRLQMAHAWWTGTEEVIITPEMEPKVRGDIRYGVLGAGGDRYIGYETGQSFLMLPADWLGSQLHRLWPSVSLKTLRQWAVNLLVFIPINIAAILAAFWLIRLFQFSERVAQLASLTLLLCTTFLHYAQVHQHNNQLLLLTTVGYATVLAYLRHRRAVWLPLGGMALGLAVFIRVTSMIHGMTVGLFMIGVIAYKYRNLGAVAKSIGLWLTGFVPVFLMSRYVDFLRFGSFFASGKSVEKLQLATDPIWTGLPQLPDGYPLINGPHVGILGPLISPAKSIFLYDPLLIPCLVMVIWGWRRLSATMRWYLVTASLNLGLHLAAYSRFVFWHGDSAWGARYHVTSVHLLLIPLLAVFIQQLLAARQWRRQLLRGVLVAALMTQIASVMMPMNFEIFQKTMGIPGSNLELRLAQRAMNIVCYVDRDFSRLCVDRHPDKKQYLEHFNRLNFFPFTYQHELSPAERLGGLQVLLFTVWGLALVAAIFTSAKTWQASGL